MKYPLKNRKNEENFKTREKFREKLQAGEMDDRQIELDVSDSLPSMQVLARIGLDEYGN
jgi:ATP-dependent HslUV protease ATP-binding subunit HslU